MNGIIYLITNSVNKKVYVGQTRRSMEGRWKQHLNAAKKGNNKCPLYEAMRKLGIENFTISKIEDCDINKLDEREMFWIAKHNSFKEGYNATIGGQGFRFYIWTDSKYEEIIGLYKSGFTSTYIANMFNVSQWTILEILKQFKIKLRRHPMDVNSVERNTIIDAYNNGETLESIANRYKTDRTYVRKYLEKWGVVIRKKKNLYEEKDKHQQVIDDFINSMTLKDMEIKYSTDSRSIKRILTENGIYFKKGRGLRNTRKGAFCLDDKQCLKAIKMRGEGVSVKDIAKYFNIHISTLYQLFKRYNIDYKKYNRSKSVQSLK